MLNGALDLLVIVSWGGGQCREFSACKRRTRMYQRTTAITITNSCIHHDWSTSGSKSNHQQSTTNNNLSPQDNNKSHTMTTKIPPRSSSSSTKKKVDSLSWFAIIATATSSLSEAQPHDEQQKLPQSQKRTNSNKKKSRNRYICKVAECNNQVVKGDVCIRHGARRKLCTYIKDGVGCKSYAHKGGVCTFHGAKKKRCISVGCTNQAMRGGLCRHHGAYRQDQQPNPNNQPIKTTNLRKLERWILSSTVNCKYNFYSSWDWQRTK